MTDEEEADARRDILDGTDFDTTSRRLAQAVNILDQANSYLKIRQANRSYLVSLFVRRVWVFASSMSDLLMVRGNRGVGAFEHLAVLDTLCRGLQTSVVTLFYFAIEEVDTSEAEFRELLFSRHINVTKRRVFSAMKEDLDDLSPGEAELDQAIEAMRQDIIKHPAMASRTPEQRAKIGRAGLVDQSIFEDEREVLRRAGIPPHLHKAFFRLMSQSVHSTPFSYAQSIDPLDGPKFKAGIVTVLPIIALLLVGITLHHLHRLCPQIEGLFSDVDEELRAFLRP